MRRHTFKGTATQIYPEEHDQPGEYAGNLGKYARNLGDYAGSIAMHMNKTDPGNHGPEDRMEQLNLQKRNYWLYRFDESAEKRWSAISFENHPAYSSRNAKKDAQH